MGGGCGTTSTFYANQIAPAVMKEYGGQASGQAGGCGCMGAPAAVNLPNKPKQIVGGSGCSGQPTMLRALGIMTGGRSTADAGISSSIPSRGRNGTRRSTADAGISSSIPSRGRNGTRRSKGGSCAPCALGRLRGGYKPTRKNLAALRKYKAGKSIGFTMRSSLKAKGLIPRSNGTKRISNKYR